MTSLDKKTIFITGASEGIGKACAEKFASYGANLILTARNMDKLNQVADKIKKQYNVQVLTYSLDVRSFKEAQKLVEIFIAKNITIDILINNAGLAKTLDKIVDANYEDWDLMIDTNVKGVLHLSKLLMPFILKTEGQIINIGSIAGIYPYSGGAVYCASKVAVKFITDALRMEMVDYPIKITNIQPGMVETNFSNIRFNGDLERAKKVYEGIKVLTAEDVADVCLYTALTPKHVQICEVTVTPVHQAPVGAVYRKI